MMTSPGVAMRTDAGAWWPKESARIPADDPGAFFDELRRRMLDPDAVILLNGDGSVHGVRKLALGEMLAEPAEELP